MDAPCGVGMCLGDRSALVGGGSGFLRDEGTSCALALRAAIAWRRFRPIRQSWRMVPSPFGRQWPRCGHSVLFRNPAKWCERSDSNRHGVNRWNLNPVRLPVPPRSQKPNCQTGGAPRATRTPDPQVRSLMLYPAELWARTESNSLPGTAGGIDPWFGWIERRMLKALSSFARGLSDAPSGASSRSPRSRRPEPGAHRIP